ncbi:iron-containing alcohol dehydrogenase family protein [Paenibacillus hamazuiensis]|uniref:iron-containing alcohol dehydrogenase family protein n=1 Tax=Paenibacillus hamazuiensis TaxID=2936508 RepID=UPI00200BFD4C|nr:iron-containing alcohol dehydrogenase family protein [Paenibacillus hamazuiensis]
MNGVHFVAGTPNAYIHKPGLLASAGEWMARYGKRALIVTGSKSWAAAGETLARSLTESGVTYELAFYRGECSYGEVARLQSLVDPQAELIVGVGAGKVIDTAKKLSNDIGKPLVTIPTLSATCAPVTNLSVMYTDEGVYVDFPVFYRNALLTLVDTDVLAKAPVRYLVAGIGDTIAKWYESVACSAGKPANLPTIGGVQAAKLCYDTLIRHSRTAIEDAKAGRSSEALQLVIDAVILFSGLVGGLGEDNCRSAAAHAVHNGLTALPDSHRAYHGEKVAYGILVQLMLENRPAAEIDELIGFYKDIGLPTKLADMGIGRRLSEEELDAVVKVALSPEGTMGNMPFEVTADMVLDAIRRVEERGQNL